MALVALAPRTLPIPLPLPLPQLGCSLILNGRARPDACSSVALATISALSASLSVRVCFRTGFLTTTSFPFLFSRPISSRQTVEHLTSSERVSELRHKVNSAAAWVALWQSAASLCVVVALRHTAVAAAHAGGSGCA